MMPDGNSHVAEIEELEDRIDGLTVRLARMESANDESLPHALVLRLHHGEEPVRVWREHRGFSIDELARLAAFDPARLRELDDGLMEPTRREISRLAVALGTITDLLTPWDLNDGR